MNKAKGYYVFWASAVAIFAVVMASSVVGLQYWLNKTQTCPMPQAITIAKPFKWIDSENQTIHYIYPDGSGRTIPMYTTVPPVWYGNMLDAYMNLYGEAMPQEIIDSVPWEWKAAVMPQPKPMPKGGSSN